VNVFGFVAQFSLQVHRCSSPAAQGIHRALHPQEGGTARGAP
jgi:hypothetical protein